MIKTRQAIGGSILGLLLALGMQAALGWPAFLWTVLLMAIIAFAMWLIIFAE